MPQRKPKPGILVVSRDPQLAVLRKKLLETAGFAVVPATKVRDVTTACGKQYIGVAVIGHSLRPAEKRRFTNAIRKSCKVPVLQLHRDEEPELVQPPYVPDTQSSDDFIEAVTRVLKRLN
jgi:DNA-binding response OmpR family regulator